MNALWIMLFNSVNALKYPLSPIVAAEPTTTAEDVFAPLIRIQFLIVVFVTGVVPTEPTLMTFGEVVLVFVMVQSRDDVPALEPSNVM